MKPTAIAVVAPSSRMSPDVADKVRALAADLYPAAPPRIDFHPQCFATSGHFAGDDETRAARACAILALVGVVNLPIVHFSVNWWNTLHQGASVFRKDGPSMPPAYLAPLLLLGLCYMAAFGALWLVRIRAEVWRRRAGALALRAAG